MSHLEKPSLSRRTLLKTAAVVAVASGTRGMAWAEDVPAEPDDLDTPTAWR